MLISPSNIWTGGILLNIIVCGALFRPLQWELEESELDESESSSDESSSESSSDSSDSEMCEPPARQEASLLAVPNDDEADIESQKAPIALTDHFDQYASLPSVHKSGQTKIAIEEKTLETSQSTTALVKDLSPHSRQKVSRGFSSDPCLNYSDLPQFLASMEQACSGTEMVSPGLITT